MDEYTGQDYVGDEGYSDAEVGNWWPFALGVPLGALGGYLYRDWQQAHPGKLIPWISGDGYGGEEVGAYPWVDMVSGAYGDPEVGAPWVDMVGADYGDTEVGDYPWVDMVSGCPGVGAPCVDMVGLEDTTRRRTWPMTKALIHSAIREVLDTQRQWPAPAYVWSLETSGGTSPRPGVVLGPVTQVIPFESREQALDHMRNRIHTEHVALALFDKSSPHWPNPVNWTKSDDPAYEPLIAQQIAKSTPTHASGDIGEIVGMGPWYTIIGAAVDILRRQATAAAKEMGGNAIGTIRKADGNWQIKAFRTLDDADDWFGFSIAEPASFMYAAYFAKDTHGIPYLENEAIGGARPRSERGSLIPRALATVTVKP